MKINDMTRKQFEALPGLTRWDEIIEFHSLVILPTKRKHDSGYRCMDFVAVNKDGEPICRLSGGSDVMNIDGIGGYGYQWLDKYNKCPDKVTPVSWSIDCLPKSGLLRLFGYKVDNGRYCRTLTNSPALSNFEVFVTDKVTK